MKMRITFLVLGLMIVVSAAVANIAPPLLPSFSSSDVGKVLQISSGPKVIWAPGGGGAVLGPTSSTNNDLAAWSGTGGNTLIDTGIPEANVVLTSRTISAGTGLTVTNSGLLTSDITMSMSTVDNQALTVGGAFAASGGATIAGGQVVLPSGQIQFSAANSTNKIIVPTGQTSAFSIVRADDIVNNVFFFIDSADGYSQWSGIFKFAAEVDLAATNPIVAIGDGSSSSTTVSFTMHNGHGDNTALQLVDDNTNARAVVTRIAYTGVWCDTSTVAATGSTGGNAAALPAISTTSSPCASVSGCNGTKAIKLPTGTTAGCISVMAQSSTGANTCIVFPDSGGTINGGSANASYTQAAGSSLLYCSAGSSTWTTY